MSVRSWRFYYKKREYVPFAERVIDTVIVLGSIGLLWLSFFDIIGEHYAIFLKDVTDAVLPVIVWVLLLWGFYELDIPLLKKKEWILSLFLPIANIAGFLLCAIVNRTKIIDGMYAILSYYIKDYNTHYGCNYWSLSGDDDNIIYAFMLTVCVLWYIIWNVAYTLNKRWILISFPLIAIIMELSVGLSPTGLGVEYLFIGTFLLTTSQKMNRFIHFVVGKVSQKKLMIYRQLVKMLVLILVVFSLVISNLFYKDEMTSLMEKREDLLQVHEQIMPGKNDVNIFFSINDTPDYTGKNVLTITLSQFPSSNIYLKGYHGTVYEESVWRGENASLEAACEEHDVDVKDLAQTLFQSGFEQISKNKWAVPMNFAIEYESNVGNVVYIPYFTRYTSLDQEYKLEQDYILEKKAADEFISGQCLNLPVLEDGDEYSLGEYDWYDDLVMEEYLQIPKNLETPLFRIVNRDIEDIYYRNVEFIQSNPLYVAEVVREYLSRTKTYGLELDEIASDVDPIQYFLTESHEGYCMHFASAGVMLLRYYGVPARYASGYVVNKSAFMEDTKSSSSTKLYTATVKDSNAHAWVEVYVDGLGWVPVEMTPGYESNEESLSTEKNPSKETESESESETVSSENSKETESESETEPVEQTESEDVTEKGSENDSEKDTEKEQVKPTEEESESGEDGKDDDSEDEGGVIRSTLVKILPILVVIGVGVLFCFGGKRWLIHYHSVLERDVNNKHTRPAVKRIHRRMYGYLRIRKGLLKGLRDKEFEELLIETFKEVSKEDWQLYMEVAKKMHFSKEDISEEEMLHCYRCYIAVTEGFFKKKES